MASSINAVRRWSTVLDGADSVTTIELQIPTAATLAVFCCEGTTSAKLKERGGEKVPHGNRLFFPCNPLLVEPEFSSGTIHRFRYSSCHCDGQPGCNLVAFEFAENPGFLRWTSLPHPCGACPPAYGSITMSWYLNVAHAVIDGLAGAIIVNPNFNPNSRAAFLFAKPAPFPYWGIQSQLTATCTGGHGNIRMEVLGGGQLGTGTDWNVIASNTQFYSEGVVLDWSPYVSGRMTTDGAAVTFSWRQVRVDGDASFDITLRVVQTGRSVLAP